LTHPPFTPTVSAPYMSRPSAFYATGTCFLFLVILYREAMAYFIGP
jgi:hypothetical protein